MAADKSMKNCKHCTIEIPRRARLCPNCHQPLTFVATVKGMFQTGGWVITTCMAGWYGISEHAEKVGLKDEVVATQETLEYKSRELVAANFTKAALKKRWSDVTSSDYGNVGAMIDDGGTEEGANAPQAFRVANGPPVEEQLENLEKKLATALSAKKFDERKVERLTAQIVELEALR